MKKDEGNINPVLAWVLAAIALLAVVAIVITAVVVSAPARGRGGAYLKQQGSTNRIGQNSLFFNLKTDYDATVAKLPVYAAAAKDGSTVSATNLTGLQSHCLDVVGQYASASGAYISKDFKDAGLPVSLDPTACEATK